MKRSFSSERCTICRGLAANGSLFVGHCNCYCSSVLVGSVGALVALVDPDSRATL